MWFVKSWLIYQKGVSLFVEEPVLKTCPFQLKHWGRVHVLGLLLVLLLSSSSLLLLLLLSVLLLVVIVLVIVLALVLVVLAATRTFSMHTLCTYFPTNAMTFRNWRNLAIENRASCGCTLRQTSIEWRMDNFKMYFLLNMFLDMLVYLNGYISYWRCWTVQSAMLVYQNSYFVHINLQSSWTPELLAHVGSL